MFPYMDPMIMMIEIAKVQEGPLLVVGPLKFRVKLGSLQNFSMSQWRWFQSVVIAIYLHLYSQYGFSWHVYTL